MRAWCSDLVPRVPAAAAPVLVHGDIAPDLAARVLWHHLTWALGRLMRPDPVPGRRHWTAPPLSRILALLLFFASGPPDPWARLAPGALSVEPSAAPTHDDLDRMPGDAG
ncbi:MULTISPECIES: hypothetical protein [unclassified Nocardiopsis]|uniref:hypothetical protein n=1 Tax=Nocardiopsis TaxID=2013 RepID=UPI00387ABE79